MRVFVLCVAFASFVIAPAAAAPASFGFMTGNDLLRFCTAADGYSAGMCYGYVEGVADMLTHFRLQQKLASCMPVGTEGSQLRDAVVQYLQLHPALRSYEGAGLVEAAIVANWNCP